jgi:two-component system OmpR family response regulator
MVKYRRALAQLLRSAGYEVLEEVAAGMESILAKKSKVHAVILDISINSEDGFAFCSWLRDNLRIPIVVLSADASREAGMRAIECGAKSYVVKPFPSEVVLRTIASVLSNSPLNPVKTPSPAKEG